MEVSLLTLHILALRLTKLAMALRSDFNMLRRVALHELLAFAERVIDTGRPELAASGSQTPRL